MTNWDFFNNKICHPIIDGNNLYNAFKAARKGSHWKSQVQQFRWNRATELGKLQDELIRNYYNQENGYTMQNYSKFLVIERGKTRAITALKIRDRVVKHALNDLFLIPHIRPHLIYDNGASLKNKGVDFTRSRLIAHLKKYYKEYSTNEGYIMIMDFSGYYDNIDHGLAMKMISEYESDQFSRKLTKQAFDSYKIDVSHMSARQRRVAKNNKFSMVEYRKSNINNNLLKKKYLYKSLSVGDQTSQITAVAFATPIDKLVTIVHGYKYYGRYMDDLYVIAPFKQELLTLKKLIEEKAKELRLFLNPKKTKIYKISNTFTFMQYKYYLRSTGYVVVRINPKTVTRMRIKLKKLYKRVQNNQMRLTKVEEMFRSWIASYSKVMSQQQRIQLINLYQHLFGNTLNSWFKIHKLA